MVEMRDSVLPRFREVFQYWRTVLRSGAIGVLTGLMPGVGEDAGAWMSYAAAKAVSKEREQFGKGSIDGLMAAETGDMSSIPGHIIPCLALGIPGSAPSAVLMAAMIIHGIQPGPMLMIEHPQFIYDVVAMTSLATVSILVFGLFLIRPLLLVLKIRRTVLMPIIFLLCTVGAFAGASRLFDIYCMLAIGIGAFFLRRRGYQMAPFVLGLVLGGLLDKSLRRGLVLSDGSLEPFFTRPISIGFATVTILILLMYIPAFKSLVTPSPGPSAGRSSGLLRGRPERSEFFKMRIALCNEVLAGMPLERQCEYAARLGYDGLEIAPFTLSDAPEKISTAEAANIRGVVEASGLVVTGLHWLLVKPDGLSLDRSRTRPCASVRLR